MKGKGKNYNSIVFITTLSVYLTLVLAGGNAPVLAHSALTKEFDIRNEIEFKEDLENKPDDESAEDFPTVFSDLLSEIKAGIENGTIKTPLSVNFQFQDSVKKYKAFNSEWGIGIIPEPNDAFSSLGCNFVSYKILPKALKVADYKPLYNRETHIGEIKEANAKIKADKNIFVFELSFSKTNAENFADYLNTKYLSAKNSAADKNLKSFYENTKVSFRDNQVFVITNLPRAAIDSLLEQSAVSRQP